jgi:hypothetical protein
MSAASAASAASAMTDRTVPTIPPDPSHYRQGLRCLHDYLRLHARAQPDKPAFIWYGRAITYLELDRWSDALAVRLAQLAVGPGDRVALFMNNCPQYIVAHVAIQKLGAIAVFLDSWARRHQLGHHLRVGEGGGQGLLAEHGEPAFCRSSDQTAVLTGPGAHVHGVTGVEHLVLRGRDPMARCGGERLGTGGVRVVDAGAVHVALRFRTAAPQALRVVGGDQACSEEPDAQWGRAPEALGRHRCRL